METEKSKFITQQDIKFIIAIIVFLIPIMACYYQLREDLALIKQDLNTIRNNDLAHIELSLAAMKSRNDLQDSRTIELGLEVERLLTLHEK